VVGRYFLDHVLADGVHACIYLFTVDMEMEPLPGFTLTSWERGYGDMKLVPDLGTWRHIPWLSRTALVFCDVFTEEGEPIEEAPRWILRRQVERAAKAGYLVKTASELELYLFRESFDEARRQALRGLTPVSGYLEDYHILQTSKEEGLFQAIRNHMRRRGCRWNSPRASWGGGRRRSTSATPRPWRWRTATRSTSMA
jgi:glutamine synthetase